MKKIAIVLSGFIVFFLSGCSGSDAYRGAWKATDEKGEKFEITFDAKSFELKDSSGEIQKFNYTQNSVIKANSVHTYGIQLDDGRDYKIKFPNANNNSVAIIEIKNGKPLFVLSRQSYLKYEDIFNLK